MPGARLGAFGAQFQRCCGAGFGFFKAAQQCRFEMGNGVHGAGFLALTIGVVCTPFYEAYVSQPCERCKNQLRRQLFLHCNKMAVGALECMIFYRGKMKHLMNSAAQRAALWYFFVSGVRYGRYKQ